MIAVLILVAVGPDRLPAMIKQVAKFYRQFRRTAEDLRASTGIDDLLRDEELRELADFRKHKLGLLTQQKAAAAGAVMKPAAGAVASSAEPLAAPGPTAPGIPSAPGVSSQAITTNAIDPGHAMLGATVASSPKGRVAPPTKGLSPKERELEVPSLGVDVVEARLRDVPLSDEELRVRQARLEAKLGGASLDLLGAAKAKAGAVE